MKIPFRKWLMRLPFIVFGLSLISFTISTAYAQADKEKQVTVKMTQDLKYSPERITVSAGETVEWINTSKVIHTVTADYRLANNKDNVMLPEGSEPFNSGNIPPNGRYSHTFTEPGAYKYFCIPHEGQGMVGTVVVTPKKEAGQ